ncbi:MAG: LicD family protein [Clostridia bacterium]|nr:LicD family protein [Clostridia bacterium]
MDSVSAWREATVEEVKAIQLNILKCVKEFCTENNIRFFLMYGTLLGAVRHKGYIPWDDDVDICMLKEDYKKFTQLFNASQERYRVYSREIDKTFPYYFAKIVDTDTRLSEFIDGKSVDLGINVDLFLLDTIPSDLKKRSDMFKKVKKIKKKMSFTTIDTTRKRVWYKQLYIKIMRLLLRKKRAEYCWDIQRTVEKYQEPFDDSLYEMMSPYGLKSILALEWFSNTCELEFEGALFPAPTDYKAILQALYGDYMIQPPKEKQITHHIYKAYLKKE